MKQKDQWQSELQKEQHELKELSVEPDLVQKRYDRFRRIGNKENNKKD